MGAKRSFSGLNKWASASFTGLSKAQQSVMGFGKALLGLAKLYRAWCGLTGLGKALGGLDKALQGLVKLYRALQSFREALQSFTGLVGA